MSSNRQLECHTKPISDCRHRVNASWRMLLLLTFCAGLFSAGGGPSIAAQRQSPKSKQTTRGWECFRQRRYAAGSAYEGLSEACSSSYTLTAWTKLLAKAATSFVLDVKSHLNMKALRDEGIARLVAACHRHQTVLIQESRGLLCSRTRHACGGPFDDIPMLLLR